jgi:hypothetical protein
MALPSAIKLFINPRTGLAFGNFNGTSQITNPTVTLGDTARFEIYLVEDTGISSYPRQEVAFPGTPGIKIAVGPIDESPQAGTWTVSFGGDTTAALAYNITAAALAAALNALASITAAGGVTVSKVADNYNIVFNQNGARGDITTNPAALIPLSAATVAVLQVGNSTRPQIALVHLQRTIAGLATSFTATPASAISIESLSAWDGSRATYRASITPDPKGGSFSLAFDAATGTDVSSASISVGASAIDVQNALNLGALADKVSVQQIGAYAYDITVTAQPGTNGLTASGAGLISFNGYVGELSLNTAEAISLLDGAEFVATTLEVEITSDSKTLTVLQIPCTLKNAVIDAGSVQPLVLDTYLSQAAADGRYARQANNLSDLADINQARTNLGVYSSSSIDSALSLKANLSGATFSGNIVRDNGLGQTVIGPASVSFSQTGGGGSFVTYGSTAVTFADGTTQNTAFTGSVLWGGIGGSLANQTDLSSALALKADLAAPTLTGGVTIECNPAGTTLKLYDPTSPNFGTDLNNTDIIVRAGDPSSFGRLDSTQVTVQAGAGNTGGLTASQLAINAGANSLTLNIANGLRINGAELYARKAGDTFTGKANFTSVGGLAGLNIGIGGTSASATTAGDLWISTGGASLNFRDGTGAWRILAATSNTNSFSAPQIIDTTATTPGLRITQKGTGSSLVVEDSTTPDSDALIIDANGNLGIGVSNNPGSIWSGSTYKAEVHGDALVTGTLRVINHIDVGTVNDGSMTVQSSIHFPNYGGTIAGFTTQTNAMGSSGSIGYSDYPSEIVLKLNGQLWAVPARQIV